MEADALAPTKSICIVATDGAEPWTTPALRATALPSLRPSSACGRDCGAVWASPGTPASGRRPASLLAPEVRVMVSAVWEKRKVPSGGWATKRTEAGACPTFGSKASGKAESAAEPTVRGASGAAVGMGVLFTGLAAGKLARPVMSGAACALPAVGLVAVTLPATASRPSKRRTINALALDDG